MDDADRAGMAQEMLEQAALTIRKPEGPKPTGKCFYCGEKLAAGLRYCDADCAKDHEYEQACKRHGALR